VLHSPFVRYAAVLRVFLPVIDTILLDVDGTLVDSNGAHTYAWIKALAESAFEVPYADVRPLIGMGADHVLPAVDPRLTPRSEPGKTVARRQGEIFADEYLPKVRPMKGARELLLALKRQNVRCVIATSASNQQVDALLEVAGVADLIDARATADDADESKPAPDIVHAALLASRTRVINAVMLGDTRYDIQAAYAAGLPAISLRCGGSPEADLSDSSATFDTPLDFAEALGTQTLRDIVAQT
jgi:phosphoglycolate phosphatase-like HAD superfamily hydrolase